MLISWSFSSILGSSFPKLGYLFGGPSNKDCNLISWGLYWGYLYLGKLSSSFCASIRTRSAIADSSVCWCRSFRWILKSLQSMLPLKVAIPFLLLPIIVFEAGHACEDGNSRPWQQMNLYVFKCFGFRGLGFSMASSSKPLNNQ